MLGSIRRVVVTGGAGFVGSHLCDRLLAEGAEVVCVDGFVTGRRENVEHLLGDPRFSLLEGDVRNRIDPDGPVDAILHLASPASPADYLRLPLETLETGALGTRNALRLATERSARFLLTSSSEVYGDPLVHPQGEAYQGNVNPVGPRSVYDEAKRFAEALTMAHHRTQGLETRIARIFNTIGERMRPDDGRAVPTFITQALRGEPLTVHGDGSQTRSFSHVQDVVDGIVRLLASDAVEPVNLGSPEEVSVLELARMVIEVTGAEVGVVFVDRPEDDPARRRPDITRARTVLGWEPRIGLREALERTAAWFRQIPWSGRPPAVDT